MATNHPESITTEAVQAGNATAGPHVWLSLEESSEATGKSTRTIRRWLDAGKLPAAYRDTDATGEPWRIRADELEAIAGTLNLPGTDSGHAPDIPGDMSPIPDTETPEVTPAIDLTDILDRLDERTTEATDARIAAAEITARLDASAADLKRTTAERDRARSDLEHQRTEASHEIERIRTEAKQEVAGLKSENTSHRETVAASNAKAAGLVDELKRARSDADANAKRIDSLTGQLTEALAPPAKWWHRKR